MIAEEDPLGGPPDPTGNDPARDDASPRSQWQKRADGWYGRAVEGGAGQAHTLVSAAGRGVSINQDFRIEVVETKAAICLAVHGELDLATVPQLLQAVADCAPNAARPLVKIDMAALEFIDSTGLRALLEAHAGLEAHGGQMQIIGWEGQPKRLFELAGVLGRPPFIPPAAD